MEIDASSKKRLHDGVMRSANAVTSMFTGKELQIGCNGRSQQ